MVVTSDTWLSILEPLILAGDVRHLFSVPVLGRHIQNSVGVDA